MKLYANPVSNTSRPILLFIADEGLDIEYVNVDLMTGEHYQEWYAKLNPNRLVPVLTDGDWVLTESEAILKYLADLNNSDAYPKDLKTRARIDERMAWFNTNFYREFAYHLIYPQIYDHHKRPGEGVNDGVVQWGAGKSKAALDLLENWILGDNAYVCGDEKTLADYMGSQYVAAGELIGVDLSGHPKIQAWLARMKDSPNWAEVNQHHDGFVQHLSSQSFVGI